MNRADTLRILADAGAFFTLCYPRTKKPIGDAWQDKPHSLKEALQHLDEGGNVGLLPGSWSHWLIALDFDRRANEFCAQYPHLKVWATWRTNAPDRGKFIVRCQGAHSRKDRPAGLEVLSTGGNAIIAGIHETGAPVRIVCRGDPPTLTIEDLAAVFQAWTGKSYGDTKRAARAQAPRADDTPAPSGSLFELRVLLDYIGAWRADDYNEWVAVGLAIKHVAGDAGFSIWDTWSQKSSKWDPDECRRKWGELKPDGRATGESLVYWARRDSGHG